MLTLLDELRTRGFRILESTSVEPPPALVARYPDAPEGFIAFVAGLAACTSRDETSWFVVTDDYARTEGLNEAASRRWGSAEA